MKSCDFLKQSPKPPYHYFCDIDGLKCPKRRLPDPDFSPDACRNRRIGVICAKTKGTHWRSPY